MESTGSKENRIPDVDGSTKQNSSPSKVPNLVAIPHLHIDRFEVGKLMFKGRFSNVFVAREKETQYVVALKEIPKMKDGKKADKRSLHIKIALQLELQKTDHPNILRLLNYFATKKNLYLILEYCIGGSLHYAIRRNVCFDTARSQHVLRQLAAVVDFCHSKDVIHRDIKPENILLDSNDTIKLAGFGLATRKLVRQDEYLGSGTILYLPPEVINGKLYDETVDTWAIGVVLFEMLHGERPFEGTDAKACIVNVRYFCDRFLVKEKAENLIEMFLHFQPDMRIKLQEVPYHPWFQEVVSPQHSHSHDFQVTSNPM